MSKNKLAQRYSRVSEILDYTVLHRKRVLIIGLGAMGSLVINQLVRHGVGTEDPGRLYLIDGDLVDAANLIRTSYVPKHIGMAKTEAMTEIIREINNAVNVSCGNKMLEHKDIPKIVEIAHNSDLLCLFADDFELMMEISDQCYNICPQLMAVFAERCDLAEIGFSWPGTTVPLSITMGQRAHRQRIDSAQALGVDTAYVAVFVASICLRLLLNDAKGSEFLPPCYANAPLFVMGLRHTWIFSDLPEDHVRSVVLVGGPTNHTNNP